MLCIFVRLVYPDGRVCISILHAPGDDPMVRRTKTTISIRIIHRRAMKQVLNDGVLYKALRRFYCLLFLFLLVGNSVERIVNERSICIEPNEASPANVDAAKMFRENRERFDETAKRSVRKTLGL